MTLLQIFSVVFALLFLTPSIGCSANSEGGSAQPSVTEPASGEAPTDIVSEIGSEIGGGIKQICSALDFDDVTWPKSYTDADEMAFALGMNITGSFEGHAGWTNLSNNFDGQGVSMGILNQNLGQGTLQPLLLHMRDNHAEVLAEALSSSMADSMLKMLDSWEKANPLANLLKTIHFNQESDVDRDYVEHNDPNVDKKYFFAGFQTRSNSASVRWARKNLYTDSKGRNFKEEWKAALKQIAGHPAYVSEQIHAAQYIHERALGYKDQLKWKQLRAYLFLFDIVVQNGSLKEKHFKKFDRWLSKQTNPDEEEQMLEMLEIRVVDSNPKWQKDVRLRKTAVIKGVGKVHGENRNLPEEYCYSPTISY